MKRATRISIAVALTIFLVATGTGVSYALWATSANTSANVKTGKVLLTANGDAATLLSSAYRPGEPVAAPITITNGGSVLLSYTAAVASSTSGTLASNISIAMWEVATAGDCTTTSATSGTVWTGSLAGFSSASNGSLAVGASQLLCVRTALTSSVTATQQGQKVSAVVTFTGSNGWTSSPMVAVNPSVFDIPDPVLLTTGGCLEDNGNAHKYVYLAWQDVPDASEYRLYFTPAVSPAPVPPAVAYMSVTVSKATITGPNFDTVKGSSDGSGSVSIHAVINGWESAGLVVPVYFAANSTGSNAKISCKSL